MLDFLGSRLQKSIAKMKAKTMITEEDFAEVTREIKLALLEADVNLLVVKQFINSVKVKALESQVVGKLNPGQQIIKIVKDELLNILGGETKEVELKGKPSIIMMVGLQGSGKTTSTAKIAKFLLKKNKITKPLLVAADVYRPAAIDQLITLGKELQIDVFSLGTEVNPREIALRGIEKANAEGYDLVIIDTAGRLGIDEELMNELYDIKKLIKPHEIFFVADALSGQDIINTAEAFHKKLSITGSIITKLDSDARGGAALSIRQLLNIPIKFIGTGEKATSLDLFHPDRMADRILGMGDVLSLIEKAEEVIDEKKSQKMMNRLANGKFDLNDLLDQLFQMKKLGSMSKLAKLIPGISGKIDQSKFDGAEIKLRLFEIIISSMTKQERKNPKLLKDASRKERIIKGSGRSAQEYNQLINEFERMHKQMISMAKSIKDGSFNPGMLGGMGFK